MAALPTNPYRKLAGRGVGSFQAFRLWIAPDHLLQVSSSGIGERYKRFYFADVQAFLLRRTWGYVRNAILWVLAIAATIGIAVAIEEDMVRNGLAGVAGIFLIVLIVHLVRGPTCTCHVRTAVQLELLPSLGRLKTAGRILAQLRPLIEAAQTRGPAATTSSHPLP